MFDCDVFGRLFIKTLSIAGREGHFDGKKHEAAEAPRAAAAPCDSQNAISLEL